MYFIPLLVVPPIEESRFYIYLTYINKCIGFVMELGEALKTDKHGSLSPVPFEGWLLESVPYGIPIHALIGGGIEGLVALARVAT